MKNCFLTSAYCLPLLLIVSAAHAQVAPGSVPPNAANPTQSLSPRQTENFGVTIQVNEAGFVPLSRIAAARDSSPHFFIRWNTSALPKNTRVKFLGLVKPENKDAKFVDISASTELSTTTGAKTGVFNTVRPNTESLLACWEVATQNRTPEDNGTFTQTYDFTSAVPTPEKKMVAQESSLLTAHDTKITLQKVECNYDPVDPTTQVTFKITRGQTIIPENMRPEMYAVGGLLTVSDDTGRVLKPIALDIDEILQLLSLSAPVTFSMKGVPAEGAKELHLKFSLKESSTEFSNKNGLKRAFIEIPIASLAAKSDFKPTPAELSPTTTFENDQLTARLDSKYDSDLWNATVWVRPRPKPVPVNGAEVTSSYDLTDITAKTDGGIALDAEQLAGYRPTGHNDGTFADEDELSFRVGLFSQPQASQKGTVTVSLRHTDSKSQPVSFECPPLMQAGAIAIQPPAPETPANVEPQNVLRPYKIAILDEALKAQLVENSSIMSLELPLGSLVVVTPLPPTGAPLFSLHSIESGTQKMNASILLGFDGDRLADDKPGPYQTLIYSTSSPLPLTQGLTLKGEAVQKLNSQTMKLTFKDVPLTP